MLGFLELAKVTKKGLRDSGESADSAESNEFGEQLKLYQLQIGLQVQKLRKEQGLLQTDLARKCGMNSGSFFAIEAGRANVTMRTLLMLANGLGVHVTDLLPTKAKAPVVKKELRFKHMADAAEEALDRISGQLQALERLTSGAAVENIFAHISVQLRTLKGLIGGFRGED